jgi:hypothetical protein
MGREIESRQSSGRQFKEKNIIFTSLVNATTYFIKKLKTLKVGNDFLVKRSNAHLLFKLSEKFDEKLNFLLRFLHDASRVTG